MFVPGKPLQPILMLGNEARTFPTNIRPSRKSLSVINTLSYYKDSKITSVKSFITLGPDLEASNHNTSCRHLIILLEMGLLIQENNLKYDK